MSKKVRQQRALERLTAQIATDIAANRGVSYSQRVEYNCFKSALGSEGHL